MPHAPPITPGPGTATLLFLGPALSPHPAPDPASAPLPPSASLALRLAKECHSVHAATALA